jgi:hypothetical protein
MNEKVQQAGHAVTIAARTVDDLTEQLEKDLRGEKDWHDRVIEEQEARVRSQYQARRAQLEQLVQARDEEYGKHKLLGSSEIEGLTAAEVQERVLRTKQLEAQRAARQMVHPELADPKVSQFLDRWGLTETEVETGMSETDRDVSKAVPITPPTRTPGTPFGRK